uniref:ORF73 38.7kd n=1 Tax=Cydia pomonella granulosis virus TaxID=28289 RepID=A0A097P0Q5_GVCP|nr:ORF73 38.7kd [Cydia pomonella granulovirus]
MSYFLNKLGEYLWPALPDWESRMNACEKRLDELENKFFQLQERCYDIGNEVFNSSSDDHMVVNNDDYVNACANNDDYVDGGVYQPKHSKYYYTDDDTVSNDSDGSNVGVFIRPRINGTTIHYITGHEDRYNMRTKFYSDNERVVDMKSTNPKETIEEFNRLLEKNGLILTHITDNVVIAVGDCESVKRVFRVCGALIG